MAPHTVNGEKTFRVGADFIAPSDEHYYGLGQNQEGILDLRVRLRSAICARHPTTRLPDPWFKCIRASPGCSLGFQP